MSGLLQLKKVCLNDPFAEHGNAHWHVLRFHAALMPLTRSGSGPVPVR